MNSKQRKTLEAVFADPVKAGISWVDIESLLLSLGALIKEGAVKSGGKFLINAGVKP